ncbi:hypothetical protein N9N18_04665 [Euryarchaeota archaeon]|nr:hypothetical protein [Euryarchaeota archaeon]
MTADDIRDLVRAKKEDIASKKSSFNDYMKSSMDEVLKDCVKKSLADDELKFVIFTFEYALMKGIDEQGFAMDGEVYICNHNGKLSPSQMKRSYSELSGDDTLSLSTFDPNQIFSNLSNLVNQSGGKISRVKGLLYGEDVVYFQNHRDYEYPVNYYKKAPEGWIPSNIGYMTPHPLKKQFQLNADEVIEHQKPVLFIQNINQNNHEWEDDYTLSDESGERMQSITFNPHRESGLNFLPPNREYSEKSLNADFVDIFFIDFS